ncbi:MAG: hypothetical protein A2Y69_02460 [Candidatus Aminicenantes bacterium RBG_13_59_9]|nr:MAG: hypothetical protein A2Y69_02460 [Candidatus Aminicenantes bacterium RBG_13_59_9]
MTDSEKQDALESIALIKSHLDRSQKEMTHSGSGWICIVWGLYTFLGYAGSRLLHLAGAYLLAGLWWPFLAAIAFVVSVIVIRRKTATQSSKIKGTMTGWFMLFWIPLLLLIAALVALCGLLPDLPVKYSLPFILLVVSTGYLMVGLMFHKSLLAMGILGFAGTMVTTLFFIEQAGLILTLLFGLGLIATGFVLNRKR